MTDDQVQHASARGAGEGSLAEMVDAWPAQNTSQGNTRMGWIKFAVLAGLVIAFNYHQFVLMYQGWYHRNWTHGFLIPLFSAFLIYTHWGRLARVVAKPFVWALPLVVASGLAHVVAYAYQSDWAAQISMLALGMSLVLYVGGWELFKLLWLPIAYLVFAMPFPDRYYTAMALPLQDAAATASGTVLSALGFDIEAVGSTLRVKTETASYPLSVKEACSGMRLLVAFLALGVMMAYLTGRPVWQRVVLVGAAVPIAIFCNILRVVITCLMYLFDKPEFGKGFMHNFAGMVMLIPAFLLLWLLGWMLNRVFVDEEAEADDG